MTSNELDKLKSQRAAGSTPPRTAEKYDTLESYLRSNFEDLEASVPKVKGVTLASRLDENPKFDPGIRGENPLVHADKWSQSFEPNFSSEKRQRRLLPSLLPYLAIAILSGGISGGGLLYFLLHYAVPRDTETSIAAAPRIAESEVAARPTIERSLSFSPVPKRVSLPPDSVERQDDPAGSASGQSLPPELNRNAVEVMDPAGALPAANASAKERSAGSKTASIPPIVEAAPMAAPVPSPNELRQEKPAESNKADLGAPKPETQLPRLPADQEEKMLKRASTLLGQNDIAGARLIFQYLAHHGSPRGAFALAESYDPKKWAGRRVTGMMPDANLASTWYARAAELGSRDAVAVLRKDKP
jgi:TPR repeat protein